MTKRTWHVAACLALAMPALAEDAPYAGLQARDIASLSEADLAAVRAGSGWGLALPAELNGYPGPAHVLEQAEELDLTAAQRAAVQEIFDRMQGEAIAAGETYIAAEAHLSRMFAAGHATPERLEGLLAESGAALARLRAVHLSAHLETTPLLDAAQKDTYARLRGYDAETGGTHGHAGHAGHDGHSGH